MSRSASPLPRQRSEPALETSPPPAPRKSFSGRESVESFVVVFIAFLVWSIEAEGFVIPTGSMAPTLLGRHKVVTCPQCGWVYTVNADREVESNGRATAELPRVRAGTCANCRFEASISDSPSFAGDRIYVMKTGLALPLAADSSGIRLNRWDVGVFKLPEDPEVRYIKRTVGMPNEVIRIHAGDLWRRPLDDPSIGFERVRRPLEHQQATQMMVYDDAHRPRLLLHDPRWRRWTSAGSAPWVEAEPGVYRSGAAADSKEWSELRYRHRVPEPDQWRAILEGAEPPRPPRDSLITDFYSYNTDVTAADGRRHSRPWFQPDWVGDLTLTLRLQPDAPSGLLRIELIKAGAASACEIDLAAGRAVLKHGAEALGPPAAVDLGAGEAHEVVFANVDARLTLQIDGAYPFGAGLTYDSAPDAVVPTADDLEPVRIAARGAAVAVGGLVLRRDVHYTLEPAEADESSLNEARRFGPSAFFDAISDPSRFGELDHRGARDYPISPGCYMMLGDNSPWSRDGRAWGRGDQIRSDRPGRGWDDSGRASWEVPERLVVGKAFCVYWPNATPIWPRIRVGADMVFPLRPSVERIRWIR